MDCKWEIVLAGAVVPVFYGSVDDAPSALDVREMIVRRKGNLDNNVYVRPEAILAVVRSNTDGRANIIGG